MIYATDLQVEKQLKRILAWRHEGQMIEVDLQLKRKRATAKNNLPFNATAYLQTLLRTDLTAITGINELSALTFISEVGMDMERWPSTKNFRSWLNIAPLTEVTGGKIQSEKTKRRFHHAGQVLRIAAITVRNTDTSLGHIFRKNMARGGPSKAILSVADKMATAIYHMIRNQVPYDPNTSDKVREKEKINLIKHLEKRLEKLKLAT
jgi:transposase